MIDYLQKKFLQVKESIWPFSRKDLKKILPLLLIKLLASFIYTILTNMKDTLNITAPKSGAEIILVLKGWVVLPFAMLIAVIFSKLSSHYSKRRVFYIMISGFLGIIALYGFVFYPLKDFFSPHESADRLTLIMGSKFEHWIAVYRNWIHSILFVTAELWASVAIMLLFWGTANDISSVNEAKKSYNLYIAAGDLATFIASILVWKITNMLKPHDFSFTVEALVSIILLSGLLMLAVYRYLETRVLTEKQKEIIYSSMQSKSKEKISLKMSLRHLFQSKYLLAIAVIVIGYGLSLNLVEVTWKGTVKELFPDPANFQMFTSKIQSMVGLFALIVSLFFGSAIIQKLGWHFSAQITPFFVGITGLFFLSFAYIHYHYPAFLGIHPYTLLTFVVMFGGFQNIASKVCKYSFFDTTKEMAFIPLDQQSKITGKAAIDVVGSRLGKSGSSWIQIIFLDLLGNGNIFSIVHILIPIVFIMTLSWMYSVKSLSKKFEEKQNINNPLN